MSLQPTTSRLIYDTADDEEVHKLYLLSNSDIDHTYYSIIQIVIFFL